MITINVQEDCEYLQITSIPEELISDINQTPSNICCYTLTLGINCCEPKIVLPIRGVYDFNYTITGCGEEVYNNVLQPYFDITLSGMNASCMSSVSITVEEDPSTTITYTNPTSLTFRHYISNYVSVDYKVLVTTKCGVVYQLFFTVNTTGLCQYTVTPMTVVIPDLPDGVEINGSTMIIYPEAFGIDSDTLPDGIYFVSLAEDNVSFSDSVFVDCSVLCKVIDYIAKYPTCNLYMLYEALNYAENCSTITYQQKCTIWNYIGRRLGYFKASPCVTTSNCKGCIKNK